MGQFPNRKFKIMIGVLGALGLILLAGCSGVLPIGNGGLEVPGLLFEDDFSNPGSGWEISAQGGGKDYYNGTYHIKIDKPNHFSWSVVQQTYGDVRIDVDVAFTGSADLAEMGVVCRMENSEDFYFLTIRSDGAYAIFKMYQGNEFFLGMEGYQPNPAIHTGINTNHITAECRGEQITLTVNGEQLASVQDSSYQVGDVGVIAGAFEQADVNVYFDNFLVARP